MTQQDRYDFLYEGSAQSRDLCLHKTKHSQNTNNKTPAGFEPTITVNVVWGIMAVCSEIHTKHINTVCGQNVELLNVELVVHIVTTGL